MPSTIDLVWTMMGCTASLLGAIHLTIWVRERSQTQHVAFALLAFSVAALTVLEWHAMRAQTPAEYGQLMRWGQAWVLPLVLALVIFVDILVPGRRWLLVSVLVTRALSVLAAFTTGANASFIEVTGLHTVDVWGGDSVVAPDGPINPWVRLIFLSNLLLLGFVVDAWVSIYRQPASAERRRKLRIVGSVLAFIVLAAAWHAVMTAVGVEVPAIVSPAFLAMVLVMSQELIGEVLRAAELTRDLQLTEHRLRTHQHGVELAERAAGLGLWRWEAQLHRVWLSQRSAQILGLAAAGSVPLQDVLDRVNADDLDLARTTALRALRSGACDFSVEVRLRTDGAAGRWVAAHGQIEAAADLAPQSVHGVIFDVSDRRRADEHW